MACQEGFEPPTRGLEGRRSIQLSYWQTAYPITLPGGDELQETGTSCNPLAL